MLEVGLQGLDPLRQVEGAHLLADDLGMKERLGFDGHAFRSRLGRGGEKASTEEGRASGRSVTN